MKLGHTPIDRRGAGEQGIALVTVLLALMALMALSAAAVEYGVGSQTMSRRDQDWNASLSAAEAGIDDFVFRLNENSNYFQYSATNLPPDGNHAYTQYVPVPGGNTISQFRYSTDTSRLSVDGTILITSTGKVGTTKRTVQATLRRRTFLDYLYYTDFETLDPALYTGPLFTGDPTYTPLQATQNCSTQYAYSTPGRGAGCTEINFISADTVNGPLHSNDSFLVCGSPHFNGNTSTAWNKPSQPRYRTNSSCSGNNPVFANPGDPKYLTNLAMPPSNSAIKSETAAGKGGCLFTGPTRIVLNSTGTMTVTSPFSKQVNGSCVASGTGSLPANGVVYVQSVPSAAGDPNYTNGCPYSNPAYPLPTMIVTNDANTYACRDGDVFVEGQLKGQLTIASQNNINITNNLTYNGGTTGTSLLGLVANNFVQVRHPVRLQTTTFSPPQSSQPSSCGSPWEQTQFIRDSSGKYVQRICSQNLTGAQSSPTVNAAILAVAHSFTVPYWQRGNALGTLSVTGAIAQKFRGPVGTNSGGSVVTGYAKNYVYDQRLKYLSPPKFLDPVASAWGVAVWREIKVPTGL